MTERQRISGRSDSDGDFSDTTLGFDASTQSCSSLLSQLELATEYQWRVRAIGPVLSPWSEKSSFRTRLGGSVLAPDLLSPVAGANAVPRNPIFQWTSIADAEHYEFILSTDPAFLSTVVRKEGGDALPGTAWSEALSLEYGRTYYWKVRATGNKTSSSWSNTGAFTVQEPLTDSPMAPLVTLTAAVPGPAPTVVFNVPAPEPSLPHWVAYAALGVGVIALSLIGLLVVVLARRR